MTPHSECHKNFKWPVPPIQSARATAKIEDEPKRNDEKLSGPRMSEMGDLCDFLRRMYAAETAPTTTATLLTHSMLVKVQRTAPRCLALGYVAAFKLPWGV